MDAICDVLLVLVQVLRGDSGDEFCIGRRLWWTIERHDSYPSAQELEHGAPSIPARPQSRPVSVDVLVQAETIAHQPFTVFAQLELLDLATCCLWVVINPENVLWD
jgi:hypothetical protein